MRRWLLVIVAVVATACGGARPEVAGPGPAPTSSFTAVDQQMDLDEEQRAGLADAGFHSEGLLQGLPTSCRVAEGEEGAAQPPAERIVAELGAEVARGPLVAVDTSDGSTLVATTLVAPDGSMGGTAAWLVEDGAGLVTAANSLAADLTTFDLVVVDTAGEGPASTALAEATDCSWALADVTHADPPEPEPRMQPDLLELDPPAATANELIAMHFPEETPRGVAFQLDRRASDGWTTVAWMTSDGNGGEPVTVPVMTEGYGVNDVGVGGPGPDHVRLPGDVAPGDYRICTANAGEEFCAPIQVTNG